jgi:hypothetical protein
LARVAIAHPLVLVPARDRLDRAGQDDGLGVSVVEALVTRVPARRVQQEHDVSEPGKLGQAVADA